MKKDSVIEKKLVGLYPLLPLMEQESEETPDTVMETIVKIIETVKEAHLKADLLAVVSIFAGEKFSSELVKKYVRREMLMNSPLFEEWVKEERVEAAVKAAKEATIIKARKNIVDLLSERFDFVSKLVREEIELIDDVVLLDELFRRAVN